LIDVTNQNKPNLTESGEDIKDLVLTLQETLPPLHPWLSVFPEQRSPKLASLIESNLFAFLQHDPERTMGILKKTSYRKVGMNTYSLTIPSGLHNKKRAIRYWCHRDDDGALLQDYAQHILAGGDGRLIRTGQTLPVNLLNCCRGPVVDQLVRKAISMIDEKETDVNVGRVGTESIITFSIQGISNLVQRLSGCSTFKDRDGSAVYFYEKLQDLIGLVMNAAVRSYKTSYTGQVQLEAAMLQRFLDPLLDSQLKSFPPLCQVFYDQIKDTIRPKTRVDNVVIPTVETLMRALAPKDTSVYAIPDDGLVQPYSSIPAWDNETVFTECVERYLNNSPIPAIKLETTWISHLAQIAPHLTSEQRDKTVRWLLAHPGFKLLLSKNEGVAVYPLLGPLFTNIELRHQFIFPQVFGDKTQKDVELGDSCASWAAYLDIRLPAVRELIVKETSKPAFEDRLKWIVAILNATRAVDSVHEWLLTLKWLIPKYVSFEAAHCMVLPMTTN